MEDAHEMLDEALRMMQAQSADIGRPENAEGDEAMVMCFRAVVVSNQAVVEEIKALRGELHSGVTVI